LSDNPIVALSSLIIVISPLIPVLLKMRSILRYAYELSFLLKDQNRVTEIQEKYKKKQTLSLSRLLSVSPLSLTHTQLEIREQRRKGKKNKKDYKLEFIHDSSGGDSGLRSV
jgi:hypothetical protein